MTFNKWGGFVNIIRCGRKKYKCKETPKNNYKALRVVPICDYDIGAFLANCQLLESSTFPQQNRFKFFGRISYATISV